MVDIGVARTSGLQATVGTVYGPSVNIFKILVKNAGASAIDLRAEDDAVYEAVEQCVMDLNPLAYFTTDDNSGTITVVMDKSISADGLQARIRALGKDADATTTSIGPNDIDASGTLVTAASTFIAT